MVWVDLIGQEKLDEPLREGVCLAGACRSLQYGHMREWDAYIFFKDWMGHKFSLEGSPALNFVILQKMTEPELKKS